MINSSDMLETPVKLQVLRFGDNTLISNMSKNLEDRDNQQGRRKYRPNRFVYTEMNKDLAYLLGIYMGDGSVDTCNGEYAFEHGSNDVDFLQETQKRIYNVIGVTPAVSPDGTYKGKKGVTKRYSCSLDSKDFCTWVLKITERKTIVPNDVINASEEIRKDFLGALFTCEGTMGTSATFGVTNSWCECVRDLFLGIGIKVGKISQERLPSGKIFYTFNIRMKDLVNLPIYISRKRAWLVKYTPPSETTSRALVEKQDDDIVRASRKRAECDRNVHTHFEKSKCVTKLAQIRISKKMTLNRILTLADPEFLGVVSVRIDLDQMEALPDCGVSLNPAICGNTSSVCLN